MFDEMESTNLEDPMKMVVAPPLQESLDSTCKRTEVHPMHVISTAISPDPLDTWPEKQDVKDIKGKFRLTPDLIKKGYPSSLIMIRDEKSRDRILVPKCQRQRLVVKEHETMLHVEGTRVHHELSRKFYWPNMINESMRSRQFADHANHVRLQKSDDKTCRLSSYRQT
jgi:hypothetical protein